MYAELTITDGTTKVDLLSGNRHATGLFLVDWLPSRVQYKGGGQWQDSPLADGRTLIGKQLGNVVETFVIGSRHSSQDLSAEAFHVLDLLLEKASNYTAANWSDQPVYLIARGSGETKKRYALILAGYGQEYGNPFGELLGSKDNPITDGVPYVVERGQWQATPPGSADPVYDLDGVTQIIEHVTDNQGAEIFVANKGVAVNLTNMFRYDDSATSYSSDLMGSATVQPFPDPPGVDDALYFISRTTVGDAGPFSSVVFNVTKAGDDLTLVYEYWDGVAWTALEVSDNTNGLETVGKGGVYWQQPGDWATTTINGQTGWIARLRVSAVGSSPVVPILGEVPWSNVNPFVEIPADSLGGTLPVLGKLLAYGRSSDIAGPGADLGLDRVIVGLRSKSRGENFTAWIPISDKQRPDAIASAATLHADASFVSSSLAPTGRQLEISDTGSAASGWGDDVRLTFDPAYIADFKGVFRCFLRLRMPNAPGITSTPTRLRFDAGGLAGFSHTTKSFTMANDGAAGVPPVIVDLGQVTPIPSSAGRVGSLTITVQTKQTGGVSRHVDYRIIPMDVILIPVDEWSGDFYNPNPDNYGSLELGSLLTIDSADAGIGQDVARLTDADGYTAGLYRPSSTGPLFFQPRQDQRLWFVVARNYRYYTTPPPTAHRWMALPEAGISVRLEKVLRYHGARGRK